MYESHSWATHSTINTEKKLVKRLTTNETLKLKEQNQSFDDKQNLQIWASVWYEYAFGALATK